MCLYNFLSVLNCDQICPESAVTFFLDFVSSAVSEVIKNDSNFSQIFQQSEISSRAQRSFHDKLSDLQYTTHLYYS